MAKKETKLTSTLIYKGTMISYFVDEVMCPNGNKSVREYVKHPGAVAILAKLRNKYIFEKQYRYPFDKEFIEVPAGKLEPNELPEHAAVRELEEETGYVAGKLIYLGEFCPTIAYSNEVIHMFYADNLKEGNRHLDFDENIEVIYLNKRQIKTLLRSDKISDGKTLGILSKWFIK